MRSGGRRAALPVLALGLAVGAAACGSASAPSKASYDARAASICRSYNAKLKGAANNLKTSGSDLGKAEQALQQAISLGQQGTRKLQDLKQPKGDDASLKTALSDQQGQVTDLQRLLSAVKARDRSGVEAAVQTLSTSTPKTDQAFDAAGITACGSGS